MHHIRYPLCLPILGLRTNHCSHRKRTSGFRLTRVKPILQRVPRCFSFFCQGQDKRISAWPWSPFRGGALDTRYFRSLIWRYGVGHNRSTSACRPSMCSRVGEGCRMTGTSRASGGCIGGNCCRWSAGRTSCIRTRTIVRSDRHKPKCVSIRLVVLR